MAGILLDQNFAKKKDIYYARIYQLRRIAISTFALERGMWIFTAGEPDPPLRETFEIPLEGILVEGARSVDHVSLYAGMWQYGIPVLFSEIPQPVEVYFTDAERDFYVAVQHQDRLSCQELIARLNMVPLDFWRTMLAFHLLGIIEFEKGEAPFDISAEIAALLELNQKLQPASAGDPGVLGLAGRRPGRGRGPGQGGVSWPASLPSASARPPPRRSRRSPAMSAGGCRSRAGRRPPRRRWRGPRPGEAASNLRVAAGGSAGRGVRARGRDRHRGAAPGRSGRAAAGRGGMDPRVPTWRTRGRAGQRSLRAGSCRGTLQGWTTAEERPRREERGRRSKAPGGGGTAATGRPGVRAPPLRMIDADHEKAWDLLLQSKELYEKHEYAQAVPLLKKAIKLVPRQGDFYYLLGVCQSEAELSRNEAEINLKKAIELKSWSADPVYALGVLYRSQGKMNLAERCFQRVKEIAYEHTGASRALVDLRRQKVGGKKSLMRPPKKRRVRRLSPAAGSVEVIVS